MPDFHNESLRNHSNGNEFDLHGRAGETHFHMNGFARRLISTQRQKVTRKWPIEHSPKDEGEILKNLTTAWFMNLPGLGTIKYFKINTSFKLQFGVNRQKLLKPQNCMQTILLAIPILIFA